MNQNPLLTLDALAPCGVQTKSPCSQNSATEACGSQAELGGDTCANATDHESDVDGARRRADELARPDTLASLELFGSGGYNANAANP